MGWSVEKKETKEERMQWVVLVEWAGGKEKRKKEKKEGGGEEVGLGP